MKTFKQITLKHLATKLAFAIFSAAVFIAPAQAAHHFESGPAFAGPAFNLHRGSQKTFHFRRLSHCRENYFDDCYGL